MSPDITDHIYNFNTAYDSEVTMRPPKCTISHGSEFQIISRLEEDEQVIMLNLIIKPADHGWCF
jgi:hypothetical protein